MNWFHSQCSISVVIMVMYLPLWSYVLDSRLCICMIGLLQMMSLSGLHSCMLVCRLVMLRGGAYIFFVFCLGVCGMSSILLDGLLFRCCVVELCDE